MKDSEDDFISVTDFVSDFVSDCPLMDGLSFCFFLVLVILGALGPLLLSRLRDALFDYPGLSRILNSTNRSSSEKFNKFRKRDRIAFVGRRVMRNAQGVASLIRGGQGRKRRALARFAKRVLRLKLQQEPKEFIQGSIEAPRPDLPSEFYEEEYEEWLMGREGGGILSSSSASSSPSSASFPREIYFLIKNMRVFGHLEQGILLRILKDVEIITLPSSSFLFSIGDPDDSMYIVQSGLLHVFTTDERMNSTIRLKVVKAGDSLLSPLSFLDYLTSSTPGALYRTLQVFKSISAKAVVDSTLFKISFESFHRSFNSESFDALRRVVQVIMVRLQRVTLHALHQYLGLGDELLSQTQIISHHHLRRTRRRHKLEEKRDSEVNEKEKERPSRSGDDSTLKNEEEESGENDGEEMETESRIDFTIRCFTSLLGLQDSESLRNSIRFSSYEPMSDPVVEQDETREASLFLIVSGVFSISQRVGETFREVQRLGSGSLLGQFQVLTNEPSMYRIQATETGVLASLEGPFLTSLLSSTPSLTLSLATSVLRLLTPTVRLIDFALEWNLLESGKALYKQNDVSDATYVVLSGRLRSFLLKDGKKTCVAEYGRGELTGIVEILTESLRSTSVVAVRDTEVAKLPSGLIDFIKLRFPTVLLRFINDLGHKLQLTWEQHSHSYFESSSSSSFSTVGVVSLSSDVPKGPFTSELLSCLLEIGPSVHLSSSLLAEHFGEEILFKNEGDFKLSSYLAHLEDKNSVVLYECDESLTPWTLLCLRHSDIILLLVNPKDSFKVTDFEVKLESYSKRVRKCLIFLHSSSTESPSGTRKWLTSRAWLTSFLHMKCPSRLYKNSLSSSSSSSSSSSPNIHSDFSRLARMLTGNSVGLVLGGGGARGCSHVGMIKSILEAGFPIDRVAGVSIGAFMGSLYCQERDVTNFTLKARSFSEKMNGWWSNFWDLTYPITAMFTGTAFNRIIRYFFEDKDIEDLWLPFFTITTDITQSSMRVHEYGSLWRYVRSSMSLAGYLPPLCDPLDGHLLLDGGYTNNLPADIMASKGAKHIFAIDVGSVDDVNLENYGDELSGWVVMWRKWWPFAPKMNVPSQEEIQSRLAYVSCVRQLEVVKESNYCSYIRPPIDKYSTLQFSAFDEIKNVGYEHGVSYFASFLSSDSQKTQFYWMSSKGKSGSFRCFKDQNPLKGIEDSNSIDYSEQESGEPQKIPT